MKKLSLKFELFIIVLLSMLLMLVLPSCSNYIGERTSRGCGVWYPKKFEKQPRWVKRY